MFISAALHGAEASHVSASSLCKLRTAFVHAVWSGRLSLAYHGAVLSLLDGPLECDPAYHIELCRFHLMRRFVAYNPGVADLGRVFRLLGEVVAGTFGHGPVHLPVQSAGANGLSWDLVPCVSVRPGPPFLCHTASPYPYFKSAISNAWAAKVALELGSRAGFRWGPFLDLRDLNVSYTSHVSDRDKGLWRGIMLLWPKL